MNFFWFFNFLMLFSLFVFFSLLLFFSFVFLTENKFSWNNFIFFLIIFFICLLFIFVWNNYFPFLNKFFIFEKYPILDFNNLGDLNIKNNTAKSLNSIEKAKLAAILNKADIDICFFDSFVLKKNYFSENIKNYNCYFLENNNCYICLQKTYRFDDCLSTDFQYCPLTNKLTCLEKFQNFRRVGL